MSLQVNYILARDLNAPPLGEDAIPGGLEIVHIPTAGHAQMAMLDGFYTAAGFPKGWSAEMLAAQAQAGLLIDRAGGDAVAGAWITAQPMYISEIARTFTPLPEGEYFFGDFVASSHRGKKLQRCLVHWRLALCRSLGRRWAFSMMQHDNFPSVKSYRAEGFMRAAELSSRPIGHRWRLERFTFATRSVPHGQFSDEGLRLPLGFCLRRR